MAARAEAVSMSVFLNLMAFVGVFYLIAWFGCRPDRSRIEPRDAETRKVA